MDEKCPIVKENYKINRYSLHIRLNELLKIMNKILYKKYDGEVFKSMYINENYTIFKMRATISLI